MIPNNPERRAFALKWAKKGNRTKAQVACNPMDNVKDATTLCFTFAENMDSSNQFIGPYYLQESDEPVMAIECRNGQDFLVTLESRSGETHWIAVLVSLENNGVSGLGSVLSMSKIFQLARPTEVTPEEQERVKALVLPVQQAILHDPELEIDTRDLRFGARPLSDWRKSNPDHPSRRRLEKERKLEEWRIRNELKAQQEAALLKSEQPEPGTPS